MKQRLTVKKITNHEQKIQQLKQENIELKQQVLEHFLNIAVKIKINGK